MRIALIGVGQAGGKITDKFLEYQEETNSNFIVNSCAINSARQDLYGVSRVPEDNKILVGKDIVKGSGVGADNELGVEVMENDINEVRNVVDSMSTHKIDAFLVVAALGGGTGSGGAPVLSKEIMQVYEEPVYGLGVLPSKDEGSIYTLNAARSFQSFAKHTDNLMLFDNDAWRQTGESIKGGYDTINEELVTRYSVLFNAGEVTSQESVGESVVDSSEVINTLDSTGISSIGYASTEIEKDSLGLLGKLRGKKTSVDEGKSINRIKTLIRKASLGRLTIPANISSSEKALIVVSGPPEQLSRKGIEKGRKWIEQETNSMEVRGGDYPLPGEDKVAAITLFSGLTDIPRIKELQGVAVETKEEMERVRDSGKESLESLVEEDKNVEPLF